MSQHHQLNRALLSIVCKSTETADIIASRLEELERENAALREMLSDADELERYSGLNGERQWGRCSTWLHPDDAVVIISAKAFDAARKEAQP